MELGRRKRLQDLEEWRIFDTSSRNRLGYEPLARRTKQVCLYIYSLQDAEEEPSRAFSFESPCAKYDKQGNAYLSHVEGFQGVPSPVVPAFLRDSAAYKH
jgi:hypothetical protein